jgi:hypothetical protein
MSSQISRCHAGEEAPTLHDEKRSTESSESESRTVRTLAVQSALPIVWQTPIQSPEQLNVLMLLTLEQLI